MRSNQEIDHLLAFKSENSVGIHQVSQAREAEAARQRIGKFLYLALLRDALAADRAGDADGGQRPVLRGEVALARQAALATGERPRRREA